MEPTAPLCGHWRLKPFELERPLLLRPGGPLTLGAFLAAPDPAVVDQFRALDPLERQALVLARIDGAPRERPLSLFGEGGYTFADAIREVAEGSPLGVRIIDAECRLVGLLLTEALGHHAGPPPPGLELDDDHQH
jgi:hypothetical protein